MNIGSMQRRLMGCVFSVVIFMSSFSISYASTNEINLSEENFNQWVDAFYQDSLKEGISKQTLDKVLSNLQLNKKVVSFDRKQPYKTKSFAQYKQSIVPQSRINKAQKEYQKNRALLEKIGKEYGVQPRFIVALWAIESNFGQNMGSYSIPDSLATLSFEGRRADFFRKELLNALRIIDQNHISYEDMKGSWAGAMGQTQFMPSSFLMRAVDYNRDGKKDIWHTKDDVFASIANYLRHTNWDNSTTWGRKVQLPKGFDIGHISIKNSKPISEWAKLGVKKANGTALPSRNIKASLVRPDDQSEETYMVYENYANILKWNRSLYFATAVGLLSDGIKGS